MTKREAIKILKDFEATDRGRDTIFWDCLSTTEDYTNAASHVLDIID